MTEFALPDEALGQAPSRSRMLGRRVLVVGAGQRVVDPASDPIGNGRAIAALCAREGATVCVLDRCRAAAEATLELILAGGGRGFAVQAELSSPAAIAAAFKETRRQMGGLDGLVLNVGTSLGRAGLEGPTVEEWDGTMAINVRGPMLCCRHALPQMGPGGSILFVSSVAALTSGSGYPAYESSKAALHALMRHVAIEAAARGVRANALCLGVMDTPLGRMASRERQERSAGRTVMGRQGTGWESAYAALFLLSQEASYVNGHVLVADGGLMAAPGL